MLVAQFQPQALRPAECLLEPVHHIDGKLLEDRWGERVVEYSLIEYVTGGIKWVASCGVDKNHPA